VPPVNIQAPVDLAAFSRPLRKTFFSLGGNSKLAFPPWMEMSSLGSSKFHSFVISCIRCSGFVSWATLMYYQQNVYQIKIPRLLYQFVTRYKISVIKGQSVGCVICLCFAFFWSHLSEKWSCVQTD
jgi:hypothetical protein